MPSMVRFCLRAALCAAALSGLPHATEAQRSATPRDAASQVHYRSIGPTRQSGRIVDFAIPHQQPWVIYMGTASGGVWKSSDDGISWKPIFDDEPVYSIGDVAVAPSDPDIVYVGTGEANNSRSSYWGNGVYRSNDGGASWTYLGLPESQHIGRVVVDPTNPDIVYVAALGHLYSENPERGLYKSTDGGKHWTQSLAITSRGKSIGVFDVVMDPRDSKVLYAAAYDKTRRPWAFSEAGPGGGIYKTTDAGATWSKLAGGLPGGMLGKIGLAIAPGMPDRVYAVIENANSPGVPDSGRADELRRGVPPSKPIVGNVVYRSDDAGATWKQISEKGKVVGDGPPYYYGQIRVDPNDPDHVYSLNTTVDESTDGGVHWTRAFRFGGDDHALWIDPSNSKHLVLGYDHGMGVTYDGGRHWYHPDELPLAQYYDITLDNDRPFNIYGGLQDNGSIKGPSDSRGSSIPFEAWERVGGGDGMYNAIDWSHGRYLYTESQFGPISRLDLKTGERRSVRYTRPEGRPRLRWNWNAPIVVSSHDSDVIYHVANVVLRSPYRGESWEEISPDLTTNDSAKVIGIGNIQYCTIVSFAESPVDGNVLWAGTDDGNVWVTRDLGKHWTELDDNIPNNPGYWVSRIEPSNADAAVAYLSYTGYRRDDFRPFLYKTADYGKSWTSISAGLPDEPINVIREDFENPNLLFVGTEFGVYISFDGGRSWSSMRGDMPASPVQDLRIHPRDKEMVVATHGRGLWITDIEPFEGLTPDVVASPAYLFPTRPGIEWVDNDFHVTSSQNYDGEVRPKGVVIYYWLGRAAGDAPKIRIYDGARLINEIEGPKSAGLHQVVWDMTSRRERTAAEKERYRRTIERTRRLGGVHVAGERPPNPSYAYTPVSPGDFRIVLVAGDQYQERRTQVLEDIWYDR